MKYLPLVLLFLPSTISCANWETLMEKFTRKLLKSVCWVESKLHPDVIHHKDGKSNSYGMCQIKLRTAMGLGFSGSAKELMTVDTNIRMAGRYLSWQLGRYGNNKVKAVSAYNAGRYVHTNQYYVKKVMRHYHEL